MRKDGQISVGLTVRNTANGTASPVDKRFLRSSQSVRDPHGALLEILETFGGAVDGMEEKSYKAMADPHTLCRLLIGHP